MTIHDERVDAHLRPLMQQAAREVGAAPDVRRRVTDTAAAGRNLRPLAAALAMAVVVGAAGAVVARNVHRAVPGGTAHPAPNATAGPSPTSTPSSATFPAFFAPSNLSLGAAVAFGHLSLTGADSTVYVSRYVLAVETDPGSPATAPVWRVDYSATPEARTLAARFEISGQPSLGPDGYLQWPRLSYDASTATVNFTTGNVSPGPRLDATPTDPASAAVLATVFIERLGLLVDGMGPAHVNSAPAGQTAYSYSVYWVRKLNGLPLYGAGSGASVMLGTGSEVTNVSAAGLRLDGGSSYPIIPWRQAWSQVAAGKWFAERGGFTGGDAQTQVDIFRATAVELAYLGDDSPAAGRQGSERDKLVPMWVFSDGTLQLFYPAVSSAQLSYQHLTLPFGSGH